MGGELVSIFQEADKLARHLLYSLDEKSCTIELPDKTYYIERLVRPHETTPENYIGGHSETEYEASGVAGVDPRAKWMFDGSGEPTTRELQKQKEDDGVVTVDKLGKKVPNCS